MPCYNISVCIVVLISSFAESTVNAMGSAPKNDSNDTINVAQEKAILALIFIDSNGNVHQLTDYMGKIVVFEWKIINVHLLKYYSKGNMQAIQKELTSEGVIWLSIISSAKNKQGNVSPEECNLIINEEKSNATAVLLDETGDVGRLYNKKQLSYVCY